MDARQHGSAARCIPPQPPAHSPRVPQAAAAARVADKGNVCGVAMNGDISLVGDHVLGDDKWVNKSDCQYDPSPLHAHLKMGGAGFVLFWTF